MRVVTMTATEVSRLDHSKLDVLAMVFLAQPSAVGLDGEEPVVVMTASADVKANLDRKLGMSGAAWVEQAAVSLRQPEGQA